MIRRCLIAVVAAFLVAPAVVSAQPAPACAGQQLVVAKDALARAVSALDEGIAAIDRGNNDDLTRLQNWLGVKSSNEAKGVRDVLVRSRVFAKGATFLCAVNTNIKLGDVFASVQPDKSFAITLGPFFFKAPDGGFDSKPGIIVHEMTHFELAGATQDVIVGREQARKLAASNPNAAQQSAENLEYFVEAVFFKL